MPPELRSKSTPAQSVSDEPALLESLELSTRTITALKVYGSYLHGEIETVGDVLRLLHKGESQLLAIKNFGVKSLEELKTALRDKGYLFPEGV